MWLPPLVERELRGLARKRSFLWLRGILALVVGLQAFELLNQAVLVGPSGGAGVVAGATLSRISGTTLLQSMSGLLFLAALGMGLLGADSIQRERQQGTLGLLFLTDLRASQIIHSKLVACGLVAFAILVGAAPALMVPVLAGGVRGAEAAMTGLGVLNGLFVSLAAGLWMSAYFRERRHALAATIGLIGGLAFGAEILGGAVFGAGAIPVCRLAGLGGWMTAARLPLQGFPIFLTWLGLTHLLGWSFLRRAARALTANWQDPPEARFRAVEPLDPWGIAPAKTEAQPAEAEAAAQAATELPIERASWLTNPRPWDADPIRWRAAHVGVAQGQLWLAVALAFLAQFGTAGSVLYNNSTLANSWGLLSFAGLAVLTFASGLEAAAGARFFQQSRQQHDLELLLTTPEGRARILSGQWRGLARALAAPVGVVLALALPAGVSVALDFAHGREAPAWSLLPPFLIAVNVALETVALCWLGMAFGLRARNLLLAVAWAVGLGQWLPLSLGSLALWFGSRLGTAGMLGSAARTAMPAVVPLLVAFLAKDLFLIGWARARLRRELRLR